MIHSDYTYARDLLFIGAYGLFGAYGQFVDTGGQVRSSILDFWLTNILFAR